MPIQEFSQAQEECRLCFAHWQREMEDLQSLIERASEYTAAAFVESAAARMPELHRRTRSVLARLSILIQVMHEIESENEARKTPPAE